MTPPKPTKNQIINPLFMHPFVKIFGIDIILTIAAILVAGFYLGPHGALVALLLIILEVGFSFDNAAVNARVLETLSRGWRIAFLSVGIIIAVFGMRILFPILAVALAAGIDMGSVVDLAINNPDLYAEHLEGSHTIIAAFGGSFLLLVALSYFIMDNRNTKKMFIKPVEKLISKVPPKWYSAPLITLMAVTVIAFIYDRDNPAEVLLPGVVATVLYTVIHLLVNLASRRSKAAGGAKLISGMAGLSAFMYLEVLDASFSLDSVVGAFAITSSVLLIALGLGVGALWVRSLTIYMVDHKLLHKYVYIEHGAHYAVFALAVIMIMSVTFSVPEVITGLIGAVIIGLSVVASISHAKKLENKPTS